ncbi:MAG: glycosyltransferase [Nitrospira sp.]
MDNVPSAGKQRVLIYCQHILGMGHLIRTMAIARALKNCTVVFVNGGEPLSGVDVPSWVTIVNLPPITADGDFKTLTIQTDDSTIEEIQETRKNTLIELFDHFRPDIVVIELFPFGRKRFAFELLPLLAHIRLAGGSTQVVCSLRDILVTKPDQTRHEEWVVSVMNQYFDLLLIHSDPTFQTLDETFSRCADFRCAMQYTGFVTQDVDPRPDTEHTSPSDDIPMILVSVGGGRVGYELLEGSIHAARLLTIPYRMRLFTGPYMPDHQYQALCQRASENPYLEITRFTPTFQSLMQQASLSISMAGYNTCMNILKTGIRALVLPFTGHKNDEQTIRAKKLEQRGLLTILDPKDLTPDRLAAQIMTALTMSHHGHHSINTDGGQQTKAAIDQLTAQAHSQPTRKDTPLALRAMHQPDRWLTALRLFLDAQEAQGRDLHLFLRNDDVDDDEDALRHLLDLALARSVPMNLEIIPGRLTSACTTILKNTLRADHALLSLDQHGWMHRNHEAEGRKCEFGPSRSLSQQLKNIAQGKAILESTFEDLFYPAFTPPWNRCTTDTYRALDELRFQVLSKDRGKDPLSEYGFREISTTLDLYTWKGGARMKSPDTIVQALIEQLDTLSYVGVLLHHKVMTKDAFSFLNQIICELRRCSVVRFHTFRTLLPFVQEAEVLPR